MTRDKSNRIFLGIVTMFLALAGTGLTLVNNWENDFQIAAMAIALATCFSAAEATFLWGHKRYESATKLWRKIVLGVTLGVIALGMSYAFAEELSLVSKKISNRSLASNFKEIVSTTNDKTQSRVARHAINKLSEGKIEMRHMPFVVCYLLTALASIAILSASERKRPRSISYGNQLPNNPILQEHVQRIGFNPQTAKAYRDNRERGYAVHVEGQYKRFVSDKELSKSP